MNTAEILKEAVGVLRSGGVILYPTDTVWGLGCDATDPEAVARIFAIKRRSDSKSLVLLAADLDMVARYVKAIPNIAIDLVEVNDRPMTLIYPGAICGTAPAALVRSGAGIGEPERTLSGKAPLNPLPAPQSAANRHLLAWNTVAEDGSVGIRIPLPGFWHDLVARFGRPLVSTSANISGEPTPRRFAEIPEEIRTAVDYTVPAPLERGATGSASQIIKVGLGGEVEIIRA
jgi:L-threonylcarbamoyladenylate synthase